MRPEIQSWRAQRDVFDIKAVDDLLREMDRSTTAAQAANASGAEHHYATAVNDFDYALADLVRITTGKAVGDTFKDIVRGMGSVLPSQVKTLARQAERLAEHGDLFKGRRYYK